MKECPENYHRAKTYLEGSLKRVLIDDEKNKLKGALKSGSSQVFTKVMTEHEEAFAAIKKAKGELLQQVNPLV